MKQDRAALAIECRTAADTLADMWTFQTGQGILRQAADALEAQAAEIARLTAENEIRWKMEQKWQDRAEKAEAALSESQALLAMAFDVAATMTAQGFHPREIRALTPADAQAALDARINAAREEGLRLAAKLIDEGFDRGIASKVEQCAHDRYGWEDCESCASAAILAKIKEADHE